MGLFFNFDKPGPGVDKDAPRKKGIFLYFELFFRKFWLLIKVNMLYFLVSLPVMAIYNFIFINTLSNVLPDAMTAAWHYSVVFTVIITILWGSGPVTGGFVYLLRNSAREEHIWIFSDFFEKSKETFKIGIIMLVLDILVLLFGINALNVYIMLARQDMAIAKYAIIAMFVILMFYTFMHYYVYELGVTFENKTAKTFKNALIIGVATLPANLLLTAFVLFITLYLFTNLGLSWIAVILISFICWISFMRFPIDFYAARMIKRKFIPEQTEESGE